MPEQGKATSQIILLSFPYILWINDDKRLWSKQTLIELQMKKSKASVSKAFDRKTPLHPLASVADTYCAQRILISAHTENYQEDHIGF